MSLRRYQDESFDEAADRRYDEEVQNLLDDEAEVREIAAAHGLLFDGAS